MAQGDKGCTLPIPCSMKSRRLAEYATAIDKVEAHLATVGYDLKAC
jgi:hypothetical protein